MVFLVEIVGSDCGDAFLAAWGGFCCVVFCLQFGEALRGLASGFHLVRIARKTVALGCLWWRLGYREVIAEEKTIGKN